MKLLMRSWEHLESSTSLAILGSLRWRLYAKYSMGINNIGRSSTIRHHINQNLKWIDCFAISINRKGYCIVELAPWWYTPLTCIWVASDNNSASVILSVWKQNPSITVLRVSEIRSAAFLHKILISNQCTQRHNIREAISLGHLRHKFISILPSFNTGQILQLSVTGWGYYVHNRSSQAHELWIEAVADDIVIDTIYHSSIL
jgi:hypothetical protein